MKVAVPIFGDRVSPRFDVATSFLVATVDRGEISDRRVLDASEWAPHDRINRLVTLAVDAVVCGGIDRWSAESLRSVDIVLYGWVSGTIEESLAALIRGELEDYAMPVAGERCGRMGGGRRADDGSRMGCPPKDAAGRGGGRRHRSGRRRGGSDPHAT